MAVGSHGVIYLSLGIRCVVARPETCFAHADNPLQSVGQFPSAVSDCGWPFKESPLGRTKDWCKYHNAVPLQSSCDRHIAHHYLAPIELAATCTLSPAYLLAKLKGRIRFTQLMLVRCDMEVGVRTALPETLIRQTGIIDTGGSTNHLRSPASTIQRKQPKGQVGG